MLTLAAYWKAILAFLSLFATNLAADWMTNGQPWPHDGGQIIRWTVSIAAGTWLVYQKRNTANPPIDRGAIPPR